MFTISFILYILLENVYRMHFTFIIFILVYGLGCWVTAQGAASSVSVQVEHGEAIGSVTIGSIAYAIGK